MALHIRGFAAPWGVENSYKEILDRATFEAWFADPVHAHDVCMRFRHNRAAGKWSRIWTDDEGIWCEGFIECPEALAWLADKPSQELSVSYETVKVKTPDYTIITITPERYVAVMSNASPVEAMFMQEEWLIWADKHIGQTVKAPRAKQPIRLHFKKPLLVNSIQSFDEISLTDDGAYKGTHFEVIA